MEVRLVGNPQLTSVPIDPEIFSFHQAEDTDGKVPINNSIQNNIVREIHDKVLMDLKDVQNFLYMLIGSDVKVEPEGDHVGMNVNTLV